MSMLPSQNKAKNNEVSYQKDDIALAVRNHIIHNTQLAPTTLFTAFCLLFTKCRLSYNKQPLLIFLVSYRLVTMGGSQPFLDID